MLVLAKVETGLKKANHAAVAVQGQIFIFGGYSETDDRGGERPIDVYELDTKDLKWKEVEYTDSGNTTDVPFNRYGHSLVAKDNIIYLWGGRRDDVVCNRMFLFDTKTKKWSAPEVVGTIPEARDGHAACLLDGFMYIFGGFDEARQEFSDTVYRFELQTLTWTAIAELTSPKLKQDLLTAVPIKDKIYLFGGRSYACPFYSNKVMVLDPTTLAFTEPEIEGYIPVGRRSHTATVIDDKMYIFGGYNDVRDEHYADFNMFDPETLTWSRVAAVGEPALTPRRRHCCVAVGSYLYIYGGSCPLPEAINSEAHQLMDLSDIYIVDSNSSLRSRALQVVLDNNLDTKNLATMLAREVESYRSTDKICAKLSELDLKPETKDD